MTITIEFSNEEEKEARHAIHGIDYWCALFDFSNFLRREEKEFVGIRKGEVEKIKEQFYEILNDYNISLEEG